MAAQANLTTALRVGYSLAGLVLIYSGFFVVESAALRYFLPLLGGVLLVEGIIGYCILAAAFGLRRRA